MLIPALVALIVTWILWDPPAAWAWGPATHVELGRSVLSLLSPAAGALAGIATRYARDFLYGNIAADVVQVKRFAEAKKHCHNWSMGLALFDRASDDPGRAFALGYMCHLAADCVAHNKFVPRQLTVSGARTELAHPYWEMRADTLVSRSAAEQTRSLIADDWSAHDELMESMLTIPLLSFRWNKRFFTRIAMASSAHHWRCGVSLWQKLSRWRLDRQVIGRYHGECVARMVSLLLKEADSPVCSEDPIGSVSLARMRATGRQLRQMRRMGILRPQVVAEAVAHLGPSDWPQAGAGQSHPNHALISQAGGYKGTAKRQAHEVCENAPIRETAATAPKAAAA